MGKINKKIISKAGVFFLLSAISFVLLSSCKKENEIMEDNTDVLNIKLVPYSSEEVDDSIFTYVQMWHPDNKKILVVFGYDFNYYPVADNLKDFLSKKYGLNSDDGLIYPVIYPEGFKHGSRSYPSDLFSILNDDSIEYEGVVILGAPEGTHIALARLQDVWSGKVPFPVVALFPQDDVLGIESACDFVIDKNQESSTQSDNELEENNSDFFQDTPEILCDIIDYILAEDSGFERNSDLYVHVTQALKGNKISNYVDPESGIPSVNHFVLD